METRKKFKIERRLNYGSAYELQARGGLERVTIQPDWSSIPSQVADAEALGCDALLSAEIPMDPFLPLAIAAQVKSKLTLGTGIAVALSRSPVSVAYTAWELQRMSGGRFMLGLGSQVKAHITRRFSMPWSAPAPRMREYIKLVKACWHSWQSGDKLEFEGESYNVSLMPPALMLPPQDNPHIPVQLAAVGEVMLSVAGEVAEGVRLHDFCSASYIRQVAVPSLRKGFEKSGRDEKDWQAFEITGGGMIATAATEDELRREIDDVRKRLAFYASTPAYRVQMDAEGLSEEAEKLTALSKEGKWDQLTDVFTEEMAHKFAAIGTHDQIVDRIRAHFRGVTAFQFPLPIRTDRDRGAFRELLQELKS